MDRYRIIGERIKRNRHKKQITQAQLAEALYVSAQAVSNWERGVTPPDIDNLCKLSEFFEVSADALLGIHQETGKRVMIGIDGGGTKTEFVLFTETGEILKRLKLPQSNPNDIGIDKCCSLISEGIDVLMEYAPDVQAIFGGIAGCASGDNAEKLRNFLKRRYRSIEIWIDTDGVNALSYIGDSRKSMALICGTGSVMFVRENGKKHRIGGWGYLFDEAGSAYDIGKEAVRVALAELDGMGPKSIITTYLKEQMRGDIWENLSMIYEKGKAYIASFTPLVFQAAMNQDEIACDILKKNAEYLARMVVTAKEKYDCGNTIVVCGGVWEHYVDLFLPMVKKYLPKEIEFVFPKLPPIYGACVECCHLMNIEVDQNFYNTFYNEYNRIKR